MSSFYVPKKIYFNPVSLSMAEIEFNEIMQELSKERPLFHNESDFQFSLAWKIKSLYPSLAIRLEKAIYGDGKTAEYIDLLLSVGKKEKIGIELKYITSLLVAGHDGEWFYLKTQSANDIRCYYAVKDIQRLEKFVETDEIARGYAIWLTNAPSLWKGTMNGSNYDDFRIYDGREIQGKLSWKPGTGDGTKKKREEPISLSGSYTLRWIKYSDVIPFQDINRYSKGTFYYSLNEVRL